MTKEKIKENVSKKQIIEQDEEEIKNIEEEVDEQLEEEEEDINYQDSSIEDRIINIEKKSNITLFLILVTFLINIIILFGVFNGSHNNNNNSNSTSNTNNSEDTSTQNTNNSYDTSAMKEISAADIASESKNETIVVVIGRQGCGYCALYVPIAIDVAKEYNITLRYIDLAKIVNFNVQEPYVSDNESFNTLNSLTGNDEWKTFVSEHISGTPLTIIIKNNKVIGGISGYVEAESIKNAFDKAGLSK